MLSRRNLLVTASATPFLSWTAALAQTPKDLVVIGKAIDDLISLDPAEAFEFSGGEINGNTYERLIVPDPVNPANIVGELAEKWEIAPDGLAFTFHLKRDAKFASGKPITAEDAAFSLQRAVKLNKSPAFIINQFGFTKDNVDAKIVAIDAHTLVLTIGEKTAPSFVLYCLSANVGSIVEKSVVMANAKDSDLGNGWMKTNSAGSGPFVVRSWKASESVILEPNKFSHVKVVPKRIILKHIPDPSAQLLQLIKGDIDIARDLLPDQIKTAQSNPALKTAAAARSYVMYLCMSQKVPELQKPQVQQAIKWAIDYDGIQKNIVPTTWQVQQSFVPQGYLGAIKEQPFKKDSAKAKALLAEAGLPNGFELAIDHGSTQPSPDIAQAIQANLAEIGIKVTLISAESRQVITKYRARQHQAALLSWGSDYFDPHSNAETFNINVDNTDNARAKTLAWRNSWQNKGFSDRAAAAVKETDTKVREGLYLQLQRDHHTNSPFALMLQSTEIAVMRKEVNGFEIAPAGSRTVYEKISKA